MSAWLRLVPAWAWALLVGLVLIAAQQYRIAGLQGDLEDERQAVKDRTGERDACRATRANMEALVDEQNAALGRLLSAEQERGALARQAQQQAEGRALLAEQQAQAVLMERTPAGADACTAASQAFDDELRRERGL